MRQNKVLKAGTFFKLDSYSVKQYENEHIVDEVEVLQDCSGRTKWVLVYSKVLQANILVPKIDLCEPDIFLT